jgi:hypothetical protein
MLLYYCTLFCIDVFCSWEKKKKKTYAKRKSKNSQNELRWMGRFVTLAGAKADWGLRYRIYPANCDDRAVALVWCLDIIWTHIISAYHHWSCVFDLMASSNRCNFMWLATGLWFSPCTPVSPNNKTDWHNITEILLKVAFVLTP